VRLLVYNIRYATGTGPSFHLPLPGAGYLRHWDGNATSLRESSINSALGAGATPSSLNLPALAAIEGYLSGLPPPAYPFAVDRGRAAEGERVFAAQCASCHAPGSPGAGKVTAAGLS